MFKKLFGKKGSLDEPEDGKKSKKLQRAHTVDATCTSESKNKEKPKPAPVQEEKPKPKASQATGNSTAAGPKRRKKKKKETKTDYCIDTSKPLEYPTTPEQIIDYHKQKAFLSQNEEWLVVELNEYECLVDSEDIIKVIAKHSKFFEIDPPEL